MGLTGWLLRPCQIDADLNAGVGKGLTHASDRWTLKFILGTKF
jgi:hypothetical protein